MYKYVSKLFSSIAKRKDFKSDDELYLYLILNIATFLTVAVHIVLFIANLCLGITSFSKYDFLFIFLHTSGFIAIKKRRYDISGYILCGLIIFYVFLKIYYIGANNGTIFYFFLVLIVQLLVPYAPKRNRAIICILTWFSVTIHIYLSFFYKAPHIVSNRVILPLINAYVLFFGIIGLVISNNTITLFVAERNKEILASYKEQSLTDALTGLGNRRSADKLLSLLRSEELHGKWCVAMIDIDNFKRINDTFGHDIGDFVLKEFANCIKHSLRSTDHIFRWGGEEFAIFFQNIDLGVCHGLMEKLRKNIVELNITPPKGDVINITVTIGIADIRLPLVDKAIKKSDDNLYYGKHNGKNQVVM